MTSDHSGGHLLDQPHHDGSPLYVSDEAPPLGGWVTLRLRAPLRLDGAEITAVWLRCTTDGEPRFFPAEAEERGEAEVWWSARMPIANPVMHYRFMVATGPDTYVWVNATGLVDHDTPDAYDFRLSCFAKAPDWGRDGTVYQIFPDRFARSSAADRRETPQWAVPAGWDDEVIYDRDDPRTPLQLFGGDLDGITEHLDHVADVGADIVYLTPVFPAESNHRYNASTFAEVDPLLGGDEAMVRLSTSVHERGWRLLGDLTTNHTGDTHEWFRTAASQADSVERDYYYFDDEGRYETWLGYSTLPKVDHTNPGLARAFVDGPDSIVGRWLQPPFDYDGWRIDVANMTGRLGAIDVTHDVARAVRRTSEQLRPDALVLAEHGHDASGDLDGDGWHGTMNYVGFSTPVWTWLRSGQGGAAGFGLPVGIPRRTGLQSVATMREWMGRYGWQAFSTSWNILGSHDTARIRTITGSAALHRVAAGLQFTLPGVPMVFAGDEIGLEGVLGEDSRRTMPWEHPQDWDRETLAAYRALTRLRRDHEVLRRGGLRWAHVAEDAMVFLRELSGVTALVVACRAGEGSVVLPSAALGAAPGSTSQVVFSDGGDGAALVVEDGAVVVPLSGPSFSVHLL